eukprot:3335363-Rhodomonas_salina.1
MGGDGAPSRQEAAPRVSCRLRRRGDESKPQRGWGARREVYGAKDLWEKERTKLPVRSFHDMLCAGRIIPLSTDDGEARSNRNRSLVFDGELWSSTPTFADTGPCCCCCWWGWGGAAIWV